MSNTDIKLFGSDEYPSDLGEFIILLQGFMDQIPEEFRESAYIRFEYGEYEHSVDVGYTRPETADEKDEREARQRRQNADWEAREKRELERLKAKYERP